MKVILLFLPLALAIISSGCKPKEKTEALPEKTPPPETMQISGQIFIVTGDAKNVVLGDVEVALFDARKMWTALNANAPGWSNTLADLQTKVVVAATNYEAFDKADLEKYTAAKKYHDGILQTASPGSTEWLQASDWSVKLQGKIDALTWAKDDSDVGKAFHQAVGERVFKWNYINWPGVINLLAAGCDSPNRQITRTDSEGRFKFVIPATAPNFVLMAKAERQEGEDKRKYLWFAVVGTPVGSGGTNSLWQEEAELKNPRWLPDLYLPDKGTGIILSDSNKRASGLWQMLEDTNIQNYMSDYSVDVDIAK